MANEDTVRARSDALRQFLGQVDELLIVGPLVWSAANPDYRSLAINNVIRRQREAMDATLALVDVGLGHLAVNFVRPALEERLWIDYLAHIATDTANRLLLALAQYDGRRSLVAQRDFIGDETMTSSLWYPPGFVDAQETALHEVKQRLERLRSELEWSGGIVPSAAWIAEQVGNLAIYRYLHAATSRAIHFSAGEILRRGWGTPGGILITDKAAFRNHLTNFSVDQLWRLYLQTILAVADLLSEAGVTGTLIERIDAGLGPTEIIGPLASLGQVPLVHASEWNLTPDGPLL